MAPLKKLYKRLRTVIPSRLYRDTFLAAGSLLIVALLVTFITPYAPRTEYGFYDPSNDTNGELYRATVTQVTSESLIATLHDGLNKGRSVTVPLSQPDSSVSIDSGSLIVLGSSEDKVLFYYDRYRIPALILLVAFFIIVVLVIGRRRGARSLLGLGASIIVIGWIIVPLILAGYDALLVVICGTFLIACVSVLVSHGFNRRTYVSLLSILIVLALVAIGSIIVVGAMNLTGIIDEASYYLGSSNAAISLSGVLTGGIIIAALGAVDDIVTTQIATVGELRKVDSTLSDKAVYEKAYRVGNEHIAALVNTLALVYVGAALPMIVLLASGDGSLFTLVNGEFVATEIVRIIVVSIGLIGSVPISTALAARLLRK